MRVVVSGGLKTKSLVNDLSSAFDVGTVEFTHENNLDNLKDLLSRGDYFDRALVMEQSWTYDEEDADNEILLRNRLNEFSDFALSRLENCEFVFIATTVERAKMISEETLLLSERLVVILKQPRYSLGTFKIWIKGSLPELLRIHGFNYEYQVKKEQSSRESEIDTGFDWGETSGDVIDTAKEVEIFDKPEEIEDKPDNLSVSDNLESELDDDDEYASRFCGNPLEDSEGQFTWDKSEDDTGWGSDGDDGWESEEPAGLDEAGSSESSDWGRDDPFSDNSLNEDGNIFGEGGTDWGSDGEGGTDWGCEETGSSFGGGDTGWEADTPENSSGAVDIKWGSEGEEAYDPFGDTRLNDGDSFEEGESLFDTDDTQGTHGESEDGLFKFDESNEINDESNSEEPLSPDLFDYVDDVAPNEEIPVIEEEEDIPNEHIDLTKEEEDTSDASDLFSDDSVPNAVERKEEVVSNLFNSENEQKITEEAKKQKGIFRGIKGIGMKRRRDFTYSMNNAKMDNATELRNLLNTFRGRGSTLVVTGTSESGKSVIAGNLGSLLNKMGYTVLIVDCDTIKRSQVYLNLDAYEAVHNIDTEMSGLKLAVNSLNTEIGRYAAIARQGLNILSAGLAADADDIEHIINLDKFTNFIYAARASYNFIIFDIDFRKLVGPINELVLSSDNIVITTKPNTKSTVELMVNMSNIDDMSVREAMFLRGDIVFSHVNSSLDSIYGYKVNSLETIPNILDQIVVDLIGGPGDYSFNKMRVAGSIQYSSNFDKFWMNRNYASDTVDGEEIFMRLLSSIMLKH